jgi:hypothetical protein
MVALPSVFRLTENEETSLEPANAAVALRSRQAAEAVRIVRENRVLSSWRKTVEAVFGSGDISVAEASRLYKVHMRETERQRRAKERESKRSYGDFGAASVQSARADFGSSASITFVPSPPGAAPSPPATSRATAGVTLPRLGRGYIHVTLEALRHDDDRYDSFATSVSKQQRATARANREATARRVEALRDLTAQSRDGTLTQRRSAMRDEQLKRARCVRFEQLRAERDALIGHFHGREAARQLAESQRSLSVSRVPSPRNLAVLAPPPRGAVQHHMALVSRT